ncbi:MAG: hypothetical protein JNK04_05120 [Myxococcales bacterium]|nr:hypothetical protein [Myxococcales bacterium]
MDADLTFELVSRHMAASVRVNGFEIASSLDGRPKVARVDVKPYLQQGENTLIVLVEPLKVPPDLDETPWFEHKLRRGVPDSGSDVADIVAGGQVDPSVVKLKPGELNQVLHHRVHPGFIKEPTRWEHDKAVPWTQDKVGEALELVRGVRSAIQGRSLKMLLQHCALAITEVASATKRDRMAVEGELAELWGEVLSDASVTAIDDPITFEPTLGGRVVHLRGPRGYSPIRAQNGTGLFGLGLSVAIVDGVVRIVR